MELFEAARGDLRNVRMGDIVADEAFNVRQAYDPVRLSELEESIRASGGILNPLIVSEGKDGKLHLLGGFRRSRALASIHGEALPNVIVPVRVVRCQTEDDALLANIAVDGAQEPFRRYDLADRLAWLRKERKLDNRTLAARTGLGHMTVSQLITARTKLIEPIVEAWRSAPSAAREIPFTKLLDWSRHSHEDQAIAFKKYMADLVREAEKKDELDDPADDPKRKPAILLKPRTKRELVKQLAKFREKQEAGKLKGEELGAYKFARWALREVQNLRFD
jgi:ParB/RepB/Spo0J family partition protein